MEEIKDIELARKLMELDPWNFSKCSKELRSDLDFAKYALNIHIGNVQFLDSSLFNNPTFMSYLVNTQTPYFTEYGTFEYSWEYTGKIKSENPYNYMITPGPDVFSSSHFLKSIVKTFPWALDFVPEELKNNLDFIRDIALENEESFIYLSEDVVKMIKK